MNRQTQNSGPIRSIEDVKILVDAKKGKQIDTALEYADLKLPDDQSYYAELKGKTVHVYGVSSGITRFALESGSTNPVEMVDDGVEITISSGPAAKVFLHRSRLDRQVDGILRAEVGAPVDLLKEYSLLEVQGELTPEQLERKQELLEKIREGFQRDERTKQSRGRSISRVRSTPPSSGESRYGGFTRSSG